MPNLAPSGVPSVGGVLGPGKEEEFLVQLPSSPPSLSCATLDLGFALGRLLIAGTGSSNLQEIGSLLESAKDLLLTSSYLSVPPFTGKHVELLVTQYLNATRSHLTNDSRWCSWSVSAAAVGQGQVVLWRKGVLRGGQWGRWGSAVRPFPQLSQKGLLTSVVPAQLLRLYQLLLFTLPGTPVFSYGDEIGLKAAALPGQVFRAAVSAQWGNRVSPPRRSVDAADRHDSWRGAAFVS